MYPRVVCECGNPVIGLLYNLFIALKIRKFKQFFIAKFPDSTALDNKNPADLLAYINKMLDIPFDVVDILNALEIKKECCRTKIITNREFAEFY